MTERTVKLLDGRLVKMQPDLIIIAEALEAGQHGHIKEGTIDYAILGRLAHYFRQLQGAQCNCGACPGWDVGQEWSWLLEATE